MQTEERIDNTSNSSSPHSSQAAEKSENLKTPSVSSQTIDHSSPDSDSCLPDSRTKAQLRKDIRDTQRKMQLAAKEMNFLQAAKFRDQIKDMQALLENARGE